MSKDNSSSTFCVVKIGSYSPPLLSTLALAQRIWSKKMASGIIHYTFDVSLSVLDLVDTLLP